jgi:hypothetical protein
MVALLEVVGVLVVVVSVLIGVVVLGVEMRAASVNRG